MSLRIKTAFLLFCSFLLFCGCDHKEDIVTPLPIAGNWVLDAEKDTPFTTNDVIVYRIGSSDMSEEFRDCDENESWAEWTDHLLSYSLQGDILRFYIPEFSKELQFRIEMHEENEMNWRLEKIIIGGEISYLDEYYHLRKLPDNLTPQLIGLWEGRCITAGESSEVHRWQYFADGSYRYFSKDEQGIWKEKEGNNGTYRMYGDLFISSWTDLDIDNNTLKRCELWEITIEDNTMRWSATRQENKVIEFVLTKIAE